LIVVFIWQHLRGGDATGYGSWFATPALPVQAVCSKVVQFLSAKLAVDCWPQRWRVTVNDSLEQSHQWPNKQLFGIFPQKSSAISKKKNCKKIKNLVKTYY